MKEQDQSPKQGSGPEPDSSGRVMTSGAAAIAIVGALVAGSLLAPGRNGPGASQTETAKLAEAIETSAPGIESAQITEAAPMVGVAFEQGRNAAAPVGGTVEITVKFKDNPKIKPMIDLFWRDAEAAKAAFKQFSAGRPEFEGMRLDRVTYSDELILVYEGDAPANPMRAMREAAARIGGAADISYAEPSMTAHPGDK
ncbi:hypothetical protein GC169_11050 [bacterium]|nr:hypothetical protein [bacterium]